MYFVVGMWKGIEKNCCDRGLQHMVANVSAVYEKAKGQQLEGKAGFLLCWENHERSLLG